MKKGFTLIELLVVVAIIGVLSSIIIVSLSSARAKAADAKMKSQLMSIKILAEKYYDEYGSYGNVCKAGLPDSPNPTGEGIYVSKYWTTMPDYKSCTDDGRCACADAGNDSVDFSVVWKMQSKTDTYFCVDSYGNDGEFTGNSAVNIGFDGTSHKCGSRSTPHTKF